MTKQKVFISAFEKNKTFEENFQRHLHLKDCLHNYSPFVVEAIGAYVYEGDTEATLEIVCIVEINSEVVVNIAKSFNQEAVMVVVNDRAMFVNIETGVHSEIMAFKEISKEERSNYKGYTIIGDKVFVVKPIDTLI